MTEARTLSRDMRAQPFWPKPSWPRPLRFTPRAGLFGRSQAKAAWLLMNTSCFGQEVSPFWHEHIKDMLPAHWASILGARSKVLTLYDTNHFTIERHQENRCFPDLVDQNNVYRHWRRWLEVVV